MPQEISLVFSADDVISCVPRLEWIRDHLTVLVLQAYIWQNLQEAFEAVAILALDLAGPIFLVEQV